MFCRECGATLNPGAQHCGTCGAKVEKGAAVPAPTRPPAIASAVNPPRQRLTTLQIVGTVAIAVAVFAVGTFAYLRMTARPPVPAPVTAAPPDVVATKAEATAAYDEAERQANVAETERTKKLTDYQKRFGALPDGFGQELTDEQRSLLVDRIRNERADRRSLLQDLLDRDQAISGLKARVKQLASRVPDRVEVQDGDRHDRLATDFLIRKGVSKDKAYDLVSAINLQDALVPGFRVWMYYENGQFGTWVTQGTAQMSPQDHARQVLELVATARDSALAERDAALAEGGRLKADLDDTKNIAKATEGALRTAEDEGKAFMEAAERQRVANDTLRYVIDSKKQLIARKIINKNLTLLPFPQTAAVATLDVGQSDSLSLTIDGSAYGLKKIKKLTVAPGAVSPGLDYRVELSDGPIVRFTILRPEAFKTLAKFFAIVLE
jgi:hypothetical protein